MSSSVCLSFVYLFSLAGALRHLHSFPTRRSSDLMHRRCCWPPERLVPGASRRSLTSLQSAARRKDISTISSSSAREAASRSEEHTSELQSRGHLVCRLLLEKKKITDTQRSAHIYL